MILCLDLSTTSTGYALFNYSTKKLIEYDVIKPKVKNISKMKYPKQQIKKCVSVSSQIMDVINKNKDSLKYIIIEEINGHKNRLAGKTLDGLHFVLLLQFSDEQLEIVKYIDSDGIRGWRTALNLKLNDSDKIINKENKKLNKTIKGTKLPIINKKTLACRFVNKNYVKSFDVDKNKSHADICDAIGLGHAFLYIINRREF